MEALNLRPICVSPRPTLPSWSILIPEYIQLCRAVAIGFVVMGFIGYFVKLIHIPM